MSSPNPCSIRIIPQTVVVNAFPEHDGYKYNEEDFPHMYPGSELTPQLSKWIQRDLAPGEEKDALYVDRAAQAASMDEEVLDPPGRLTGQEKADLMASQALRRTEPVEIAKPAQDEEIPYLSPPKPRRPSEALGRSYVSLPPLSGSEDAGYEAAMKAQSAAQCSTQLTGAYD